MAEEKQLTVAELLARNNKERTSAGGDERPRRRRRRSLEDGGISVAELTGSLPKVDKKPAQAKHSNVDIDETSPVIPAPVDPEEKAAADKLAAEKAAAEKAAAEKAAAAKAAAEKAADKAAAEKAAAAKAAADKAADKAAAEKAAAEKAAAEKRAADARKAEEIKRAEFARKAAAAKKAAAEKAAAEKAAADKAADKAAAESSQSPELLETLEPQDKSLAESPTRTVPSADDTAVIDKVPDNVSGTYTPLPADNSDLETTGEMDVVQVEEEPAKANPAVVVVLALAGIVLGAVLFKGFEILWGSLDRILVAVLAVAVCALLAGLVHVMRTERDKLSVVLAVAVGLLLTFAPLLLV
ncbi:hypothetical protein CPHO_01620 [Corynebacterium phocae]|uniref:Uncharacterized protein n=1 Tax=Corynebacterium phocae TaxID=161895 RepID=A0A1L7D1I1_9CORY|nr:hypothetical protein [Corynebacterium phocae]APT91821.1 hypothetical protein CPHO_01620 [Corynebacterium phocae]KAA8727936.1 tripartite tricarboxylate transporter TctB family protein [Corynebacterium phocae]